MGGTASLQDLGNIGEFVGAIGVVISLIYLAIQIRHNTRQMEEQTKAVRVEALDEAVRSYSEHRRYPIEHPELQELYGRGQQDVDGLTDEEKSRFDLIMSASCGGFTRTTFA